MAKKRVLCFGDSLTWGFDPAPTDFVVIQL